MKKLSLIFIVLLLLLSGCAPKADCHIAATTLPVYEFTYMLCDGTDITVARLITEDVSCLHDYSVQVSQMQKIESAQAVVLSGGGLEAFLDGVLTSEQAIIDASAGIAFNCNHGEHENGHDHENDPHIWLSPENAKQMCSNIAAQLSSLYPAQQETFSANLERLLAKLDALQQYGHDTLQDLSCRELITFHDGFSYFADAFDLTILKAIEEESGSEVSARELTELCDLIVDHQIPAIFTETNGSTASAAVLCAELGTKTYALDMAMSGNSYFDAMYHNIDTLKEALK
jgi:ABC-type Zn uptake system ZnuABC Zn-binding protein ZnuA